MLIMIDNEKKGINNKMNSSNVFSDLQDVKGKPMELENCKKEFKSARSRKRHEDHFCHTINVPAVNEDKHVMKRYKCNYCSKIFSNEGDRIRHQDYFCKDKQKVTICPLPEKKLKRCDEAESRSGGSANSKLRKISDQFVLSTDQSLAKHLNNNNKFLLANDSGNVSKSFGEWVLADSFCKQKFDFVYKAFSVLCHK